MGIGDLEEFLHAVPSWGGTCISIWLLAGDGSLEGFPESEARGMAAIASHRAGNRDAAEIPVLAASSTKEVD